jgi:hypothetical protein
MLVALTLSVGGVLASTSFASASRGPTYWVSDTAATTTGAGTSCAAPGFTTVQAAVVRAQTAPAATILVCPGTYAEQLQVTGGAHLTIAAAYPRSGVVLTLPAHPADATTSCDTANPAAIDQDGLVVCGTSRTELVVSNLEIDDAWAPGTPCSDSLYGILVGGGSTFELFHSTIKAAGAGPLDHCSTGVGIQSGLTWTTGNEVGHVVVAGDAITGYQENGITIEGRGSTGAVWDDAVVGAGVTSELVQNGIQVSNGARASIARVVVQRNECDAAWCGPDPLGPSGTQAAGVLFDGAAPASRLIDSVITGNDVGMYFASNDTTAPTRPEVFATHDTFEGNRYEGVAFDQGYAVLGDSRILGGDVGVLALQYPTQGYGPNGVVVTTVLGDQSKGAVEVRSADPSSDPAGSLTFWHCQVAGAVVSDATRFALRFH